MKIMTTYRLEEAAAGTVLKGHIWISGTITDEARTSYRRVLGAFETTLRAYLARTA